MNRAAKAEGPRRERSQEHAGARALDCARDRERVQSTSRSLPRVPRHPAQAPVPHTRALPANQSAAWKYVPRRSQPKRRAARRARASRERPTSRRRKLRARMSARQLAQQHPRERDVERGDDRAASSVPTRRTCSEHQRGRGRPRRQPSTRNARGPGREQKRAQGTRATDAIAARASRRGFPDPRRSAAPSSRGPRGSGGDYRAREKRRQARQRRAARDLPAWRRFSGLGSHRSIRYDQSRRHGTATGRRRRARGARQAGDVRRARHMRSVRAIDAVRAGTTARARSLARVLPRRLRRSSDRTASAASSARGRRLRAWPAPAARRPRSRSGTTRVAAGRTPPRRACRTTTAAGLDRDLGEHGLDAAARTRREQVVLAQLTPPVVITTSLLSNAVRKLSSACARRRRRSRSSDLCAGNSRSTPSRMCCLRGSRRRAASRARARARRRS